MHYLASLLFGPHLGTTQHSKMLLLALIAEKTVYQLVLLPAAEVVYIQFPCECHFWGFERKRV